MSISCELLWLTHGLSWHHQHTVYMPSQLQVVGMGLLLSFIGLQTAKIVVADPETMVKMGDITALEPMLAILGLAVIASLHYR